MIHPFLNDLDSLSDEELHAKLRSLTEKYFMTNNPSVQSQMLMIMEDIKHVQAVRIARRQEEASKEMQELNDLIKIK